MTCAAVKFVDAALKYPIMETDSVAQVLLSVDSMIILLSSPHDVLQDA